MLTKVLVTQHATLLARRPSTTFARRATAALVHPKATGRTDTDSELSALSEQISTSGHAVACKEIIRLTKAHEIATAELVGYYGRR